MLTAVVGCDEGPSSTKRAPFSDKRILVDFGPIGGSTRLTELWPVR